MLHTTPWATVFTDSNLISDHRKCSVYFCCTPVPNCAPQACALVMGYPIMNERKLAGIAISWKALTWISTEITILFFYSDALIVLAFQLIGSISIIVNICIISLGTIISADSNTFSNRLQIFISLSRTPEARRGISVRAVAVELIIVAKRKLASNPLLCEAFSWNQEI